MKKQIKLYTDGACAGNPGIGGWSCVHYDAENNTIWDAYTGGEETYMEGHLIQKKETTNNRMEIMALLKALELAATKYKDCDVIIYCDSSYVVNTFNEWIFNWARNNWINSSKEQVKNLDLILKLYEYAKKEFPNYGVYKIAGHNNEIGNELADAYAVAERSGNASKLAKILKENDITLAIE